VNDKTTKEQAQQLVDELEKLQQNKSDTPDRSLSGVRRVVYARKHESGIRSVRCCPRSRSSGVNLVENKLNNKNDEVQFVGNKYKKTNKKRRFDRHYNGGKKLHK